MSNITNLPQQPLPIGTEQSTNSYPELNNYNTSQPDVTQLPNYFQNGQYLQPNPLWNNSMWSNPLPNNIMQPQLQIYNPYSQFQIDTIKSVFFTNNTYIILFHHLLSITIKKNII